MPRTTTWEIYEIQHCRGPGYPERERYQFVDGNGRRRHFSTKVRAKLERDKAKALFTQEGKLAAGMDEPHRRDAAQAIGLLPAGWTLTLCVQFVADHVKRTTQVLSIEEALDRFLMTKEKTSDFHSNDLARRLKRWAGNQGSDPTDSRGDKAGSRVVSSPIFGPKLYQSSRGPFQSVRLRFQNRSDAGQPSFDHRETSDQASQARDLERRGI